MIKFIIEKELREIIGSTRFAITFGACSVLLLLSFYVGARNFQISMEQYEASKREDLRKLEGVTDWNMVRDLRIFLPPQPMTSLVMGVSNDIGRTVEIRGSGELNGIESRYGDDPIYAVFRFLDLDFIFQIILSLFAILFAYDAVNGEKERGTLRLTLANAVPRSSYILGKMAGSFLALAVPLLIPMLLGILILVVMQIPMKGDDWIRLGLVVLAGYFYFTVFLSLGLLVSSRTEKSSTSFLYLLVFWILSVMIVPRTAVLLAGRAIDVPSVDQLASEKSRFSASLWQEQRKKMSEFRAPENTPPPKMMEEFQKFMSSLGEEREKKMSEFSERLNEKRLNKQREQEELAFSLARISPSAVFSLVSTTVAGTGIHLKDLYKAEAERYQESYAEFIRGKTGQNPSGGMVFRFSTGDEEKKEPINPHEIPVFNFEKEPLSASFGSISVDFGILILCSLLFFAGAFRSFLHYDAR